MQLSLFSEAKIAATMAKRAIFGGSPVCLPPFLQAMTSSGSICFEHLIVSPQRLTYNT